MKEVKIKSITWERLPYKRTKREFDNGEPENYLSPIITTEIPKGFNPMAPGSMTANFFVTGLDKKEYSFYKVGYHVANNELTLKSYSVQLDKEMNELKVFY